MSANDGTKSSSGKLDQYLPVLGSGKPRRSTGFVVCGVFPSNFARMNRSVTHPRWGGGGRPHCPRAGGMIPLRRPAQGHSPLVASWHPLIAAVWQSSSQELHSDFKFTYQVFKLEPSREACVE